MLNMAVFELNISQNLIYCRILLESKLGCWQRHWLFRFATVYGSSAIL